MININNFTIADKSFSFSNDLKKYVSMGKQFSYLKCYYVYQYVNGCSNIYDIDNLCEGGFKVLDIILKESIRDAIELLISHGCYDVTENDLYNYLHDNNMYGSFSQVTLNEIRMKRSVGIYKTSRANTIFLLVTQLCKDIDDVFNVATITFLGLRLLDNNKLNISNNIMKNYNNCLIPREQRLEALLQVFEGNPFRRFILEELFKFVSSGKDKDTIVQLAYALGVVTAEITLFELKCVLKQVNNVTLKSIYKMIEQNSIYPIAKMIIDSEDMEFEFIAQVIIYNEVKKNNVEAMEYYIKCCQEGFCDDFLISNLVHCNDTKVALEAKQYIAKGGK